MLFTWNLGRQMREVVVLDVAFVTLTLVFFLVSAGYVVACDRLRK